MVTNDDRIDGARLRSDPEYLAGVVCAKFRAVDTYHRGLITATAFSKALRDLGLGYGEPEVELILQYCTTTDDGYVHYKDLLRIVKGPTPRGKKTTAKGAIFPTERDEDPTFRASGAPFSPTGGAACVADRTDEIRQVYARWDRGRSSNEEFKDELRGLGFTSIPREVERLLKVHGAARNMTFGQLIYALQVEENDGRRARGHSGLNSEQAQSGSSLAATTGGELRSLPASTDPSHVGSSNPSHTGSSKSFGSSEVSYLCRQALCDFSDGRIPAVTFRTMLRQQGVHMSPELDRLIRIHESDNSVRFQDLARAVLRQERKDGKDVGTIGTTTPSTRAHSTPTPCRSRGSSVSDHHPYPPPSQSSSNSGPVAPYASGGTFSTASRRFSSLSEVSNREHPRSRSSAGRTPPYAVEESIPDSEDLANRSIPMEELQDRNSNGILNWSSSGRSTPCDEQMRPGKRFLGGAATASRGSSTPFGTDVDMATRHTDCVRGTGRGSSTPFGTDADVGLHAASHHLAYERPAPFGTSADLGHRRPEDAGTCEYRVASAGTRRVQY